MFTIKSLVSGGGTWKKWCVKSRNCVKLLCTVRSYTGKERGIYTETNRKRDAEADRHWEVKRQINWSNWQFCDVTLLIVYN